MGEKESREEALEAYLDVRDRLLNENPDFKKTFRCFRDILCNIPGIGHEEAEEVLKISTQLQLLSLARDFINGYEAGEQLKGMDGADNGQLPDMRELSQKLCQAYVKEETGNYEADEAICAKYGEFMAVIAALPGIYKERTAKENYFDALMAAYERMEAVRIGADFLAGFGAADGEGAQAGAGTRQEDPDFEALFDTYFRYNLMHPELDPEASEAAGALRLVVQGFSGAGDAYGEGTRYEDFIRKLGITKLSAEMGAFGAGLRAARETFRFPFMVKESEALNESLIAPFYRDYCARSLSNEEQEVLEAMVRTIAAIPGAKEVGENGKTGLEQAADAFWRMQDRLQKRAFFGGFLAASKAAGGKEPGDGS